MLDDEVVVLPAENCQIRPLFKAVAEECQGVEATAQGPYIRGLRQLLGHEQIDHLRCAEHLRRGLFNYLLGLGSGAGSSQVDVAESGTAEIT